MTVAKDIDLTFHPLTPERWPDLEDLFGPERGANSGCWCMWPRARAVEFKAMHKSERKARFRELVHSGPAPGLLAYEAGKAVGWCAIGPRESVSRFNTAKVSRPVEPDEERGAGQTLAITCFFIRPGYRRLGLAKRLAIAAIELARKNGAAAVEACPIDADRPLVWGDGFVGISATFAALGFREIARRSPRRPLMRLTLAA